jgi:lysyl endopeptidase
MNPFRHALLLSLLPGLAAAADYPRHALPASQVQEAVEASKDEPLRYAVAQPVNLNTPDGAWDSPAADVARWRLGIESEGAESLALRLEDLRLPTGSELRWIGEDSGDIQGPFGSADSGSLWLPVVRGSRALLELRVPAALKDQFGLRIAEAQHGYQAFQLAGTAKGQFGRSSNCNIDVACPTANDWLTQVRSVVLLTINNSAICSGTLVNSTGNTRNSQTPYVLTANHCGFDQVAPSSIRAYFNVNRDGCGSGADGSISQNIAVAEVMARSTTSDFALLRLGGSVAGFNVYFAGWDANGAIPSSGAAIHHPAGDDKKISIYGGGTTKVDNVSIGKDAKKFTVDAWKVFWNLGTTQPGSSGSALWNQDGRVIGTLSGGGAACSGSGSNGLPDYFGRLELAWSGEDKALGSTLQPYLAPGDTSIRSFGGLDLGTNPPPATVDPPVDDDDGDKGGGGGALPGSLLAGLAALLALRRSRSLRR